MEPFPQRQLPLELSQDRGEGNSPSFSSMLPALSVLQPGTGLWPWLHSPCGERGAMGLSDLPAETFSPAQPLIGPAPWSTAPRRLPPHCLPLGPGHVAPSGWVEERTFREPPLTHDSAPAGEKSQACNRACGFLGKTTENSQLGMVNPQSPLHRV